MLGVSFVEELFAIVDIFHEILAIFGVLGPSVLSEIVGVGIDAAFLSLKVAVHKDGIISRAFIGINPIFATLKLWVSSDNIPAGLTRRCSSASGFVDTVQSLSGQV